MVTLRLMIFDTCMVFSLKERNGKAGKGMFSESPSPERLKAGRQDERHVRVSPA
jgi:hypothetical protein